MSQLNQQIAKALRLLREVEHRPWHDILLTSQNPIDPQLEGMKLLRIAEAYMLFLREFEKLEYEGKHEAYFVLKAAYDNKRFPPRRHLNRAQFERLLDLHLEGFLY